MSTKRKVLLVLLVSTLIGGATWVPAASGQTVLHVVLPADTNKVRLFDHDHNGLYLGDRAASRGPLRDADGSRVGTAYGECVVHRRINGPEGLWTCTYVLELAGGDLTLKGLDPRGPGAYEMAILGGTGTYATASGDATFTDAFSSGSFDSTDMMIRLTN